MPTIKSAIPTLSLLFVIFIAGLLFLPPRVYEDGEANGENAPNRNNPGDVTTPLNTAYVSEERSYGGNAKERKCLEVSALPNSPEGRMDLLQQCRMAVAAEDMAYYTKISIVAGLFGIFLVALTFYANKESAEAALLMVKQDRAWITLKSTQAMFYRKTPTKARSHVTKFIWENTGGSPAVDIRISGKATTDIPLSISDEHLPWPPLNEFVDGEHFGFLGSNGMQEADAILTPREMEAAINQGLRIIVYTRATYRTIHADIRGTTIVCHEVRYSGEEPTSRLIGTRTYLA